MSILCICGLSSLSIAYQSVQENVRKRITDIEKSVLALRRAIHEGVTSSDMELFVVENDTPYESRTMVDTVEMEPLSDLKPQRVLCTVGLGLRRTTTRETADSKEYYLQTDLLKRPEVALVGLLDSFSQPIDPDFDAYLRENN